MNNFGNGNRLKPIWIFAQSGMLLLGLFCSPGWGEWDLGRYGGEFLEERGGARYLALGRAGSGVKGDVWSILWNPASIPTDGEFRLGFIHNRRFEGLVTYDAVALVIPQPDGSSFSMSLVRSGVSGIPFTRLQDPNAPISPSNRVLVDKQVSQGDYALSIGRSHKGKSGGKRLPLNWGIAPKLIFKHIGTYRAYGLGLDGGLYLNPRGSSHHSEMEGKGDWLSSFSLGLTARDIGGTLIGWEQSGRKEIIPTHLRGGFSLTIPIHTLEAEVMPAIEMGFYSDRIGTSEAITYHTGVEYCVRRLVSLRIGSDDGKTTLGAGLRLGRLSVDYAFIGHSQLGDSHRISLDFSWKSAPLSLR